jgi:hypothetical protein
MDDFIEMEKLAVVSVEKDAEISHASVEENNEIIGLSETLLDETTSVSDSDHLSEFSTSDHDVVKSQRVLNESIGKMIELIEGINVPTDDNNNQGSPTGYMVRVFQWKTSDLSDVLQKILNVCYSSLDDKADHEKFAAELTAALEWIINHCFLLRDVSSMEDAIKKQFSWDDTQSENEAEIGMFTDAEKLQTDTNRFQELEKTIAGLRLELQTLKESNRKLEDQIQNQASVNTDLETQLTETELKEAYHKILELEVELESKNQYCEELDTKCVELQLQLQRYKVI